MVTAFCAVASKHNLHPSKSPKKRRGQYIGWGSAAGVAVLEYYFSPAHRLLTQIYRLASLRFSVFFKRYHLYAGTKQCSDFNGNTWLKWVISWAESPLVLHKKSQVVPSLFSWVVEELRHTQWELCEKQFFIVIIQLLIVSSHKIIWTHQHLQNVIWADFPLQV